MRLQKLTEVRVHRQLGVAVNGALAADHADDFKTGEPAVDDPVNEFAACCRVSDNEHAAEPQLVDEQPAAHQPGQVAENHQKHEGEHEAVDRYELGWKDRLYRYKIPENDKRQPDER